MGNNTSERMHSSSLQPGDQLIELTLDSWSARITNECSLTVRKVTKTRVVLDTRVGQEKRLLLDRDGWVQNRYEGDSYRHIRIFTPDDAELAGLRERNRAEELMSEAKQAIKEWQSYTSDRTKARAAVGALQAWIDAAAVIDAKENPL